MRRWAWHFLGFKVFAESTNYGFISVVLNVLGEQEVNVFYMVFKEREYM